MRRANTRSPLCAAALTVLLAAGSGCDIFDDATAFSFSTGWQSFAIDANAVGLSAPAATIPDVPCTGQDICAQASAQLSCGGGSYGCAIQCGSDGKCEAAASAEQGVDVDISSQVKNKTSADTLSKVELNRIEYEVPTNTLNFRTPELTFYVGPNTATHTSDPGVTLLGTMPAQEAGAVTSDVQTMPIDGAGREALSGFVRNYRTPFKLLVEATLTFGAGQALPKGQMQMRLQALLKADLL